MTDPLIIRQDTPHEVTVTEGVQVASTRSIDPKGPQVRKVLANDDTEAAESDFQAAPVPPPLVKEQASSSDHIFERHAYSPSEELRSAPGALASESVDEAIVFNRSLPSDESKAASPGTLPHSADSGVVFERSIQDLPAEAIEGLANVASAAGLLTERSLQDHRESLPEDLTPAAAEAGPLVEHGHADRFIAAPPAGTLPDNFQALPPDSLTAPDRFVAPAEGSVPANVQFIAEPVARADAPPAPELPALSSAQALAEVMETAKEIQDEVLETMGAAEPVWVEMDFPARVVRLKIENDKVRTKLESLEAMSRSV